MANLVKLYDTVTIVPANVDTFVQKIKDNYIPSGPGNVLRVDIVATHSGRLTRNHGFYLPQKMKDGVSTLLENYGKPILVHHDSHRDPIGRVVAAQYVDTSNTFIRNSAMDSILKDLCKPNVPYYQLLKLIDRLAASELLRDPNYPGLGYILATAEIKGQENIQKLIDKLYLTVSIGASTDRAVCSICGKDWVEEGPCDHRPGKMYPVGEDKVEQLAFIIAGKLMYDEISFVNVPADPLARVITIQNGAMQDSITVESCDRTTNVVANFSFADSDTGGIHMAVVDTQTPESVVIPDPQPKDEPAVVVADPVADPVVVQDTQVVISEPSAQDVYAKKFAEIDAVLAELKDFANTLKNPVVVVEEPTVVPPVVVQDDTVVVIPPTICKTCEEAASQLKTVQQELADITAEHTEAQKDYVVQMTQVKAALADTVVRLDKISGKEIKDLDVARNEIATMSITDLVKKVEGLKSSMNLDIIVAKVNDGMSGTIQTVIENPTLTDNLVQDSTQSGQDPFVDYKIKYHKVLAKDGFQAAVAFITKLVQGGLVPADFDPEK